jgi:hypothetical protein
MDLNKSEGSANGGEGQPKPVDATELQSVVEQLKKSNERLLAESKDYKQKYQAIKGEIDNREQSTALEKGDYQKMVELERKKSSELAAQLERMKEVTLKQAIRGTVAKFAQDVHDVDDLLNQPKFTHILKEGIDLENLSVNEDKAKEYVNAVLSEKSWLKKSPNQAGAMTKKPGAGLVQSKSVDQMSAKEIEELIRSKF